MNSPVEEKMYRNNFTALNKVIEIVQREKLTRPCDRNKKITEFQHPHELEEIFDLKIIDSACSAENLDDILETLVQFSIKTHHPRFLNQFYAGVDDVALAGAWILEALNTNQHTFEVAPVFMVIEKYVIEKISALFGWTEADGLFCPGGSMANMYAMQLAKHKVFPEVKNTGLFGRKPLVAFTSNQSHYSIQKAAMWMGIGFEQVVQVETDVYGAMIPEALKSVIQTVKQNGRTPFFVNATAGTTVLGAFDPFEEINSICEEEKLWLHIDGCWGGGAILSTEAKHRFRGCEKADSISWNAHKMIGIALQCSVFLVRHKGLLQETNGLCASYLFQQDKFYDMSYDLGDKSIQCGKKADGFKLWFTLKAHGMEEIKRRVDYIFGLARHLERGVASREGFRPVQTGLHCTNVCFWYIPPSLRGLTEDQMWWKTVDKVAPKIKERMVRKGSLMIGYQPLPAKNLVNFFRVVISSCPERTKADMDFILDEIDFLGQDL